MKIQRARAQGKGTCTSGRIFRQSYSLVGIPARHTQPLLAPGRRSESWCHPYMLLPQGCSTTSSNNFHVFISWDTEPPDSVILQILFSPLRKTIRPGLSNDQEGIFGSLAEV